MILMNRIPRRKRADASPTVALSMRDWCAANVLCPVDQRYDVDMSSKIQLSSIQGDSGKVNLSTREKKYEENQEAEF